MRRILLVTVLVIVGAGAARADWLGTFGATPETNITAFAPYQQGFVAAGLPVQVLNESGQLEYHAIRYWENGVWRTEADAGPASILGGNQVFDIVMYRNDPCIGGSFTNLGPDNFNYFACWSTSGQNWYQPGGNGNGPNLPVNSVWFDGSIYLYIGGEFFEVQDDQGMPLTANRVVRTDGAAWEVLTADGGNTNGVPAPVNAVKTFNGFVWVIYGNAMARFNPTNPDWTLFGSAFFDALPRNLADVEFFDNEVVVSGPFNDMGSTMAPGVATSVLSAPNWMTLDDGSQGPQTGLFKMMANSSYVYVVGDWPDLAGADGLARWTGSVWEAVDTTPLGTGLSSTFSDVIDIAGSDICVRHGGFLGDFSSRTVVCKTEPAGVWKGTNQGLEPRAGGGVTALAEYDGEVYAAGSIITAGTDATAANLASWNGSRWSAVGDGVDGAIDSLAVFQGELYAAGQIDAAGGRATGDLIAWNGTQWRSPGSTGTTASRAYALNDKLYFFGQAGACDNVLRPICSWDGSSFEQVTGGLPEVVVLYAFGEFNGQLVAAGNFRFEGNARQDLIAILNVDRWEPLVSFNTGGKVYALGSDDTHLYFGGNFTSNVIGAPSALNGIGRFDGSQIEALGTGVSGGTDQVDAISFFEGQPVIAGGFEFVNGVLTRGIARWNGTTWEPFGRGLQVAGSQATNYVGQGTALLPMQNLYVAGRFDRTGDQWAENIGIYQGDVVFANGFE